jgi:hypothetical protein
MTDEQINAAIHAALANLTGCPRCSDPECAYNHGLNYCTDLNAMHEAETTLLAHDLWTMAYNLPYSGALNFRASARQRAEAFLRTLGKWEEENDRQ